MDDSIWIYVGIFVILDLALITFVVISKSRRVFSNSQKAVFLGHWNNIQGLESARAVIESDKLLDEILSARGYTGTLGEKFKKAGPAFTNVNDVWAVHKLRNRLAHELGVKLNDKEAYIALKKYERAFRDLGLF